MLVAAWAERATSSKKAVGLELSLLKAPTGGVSNLNRWFGRMSCVRSCSVPGWRACTDLGHFGALGSHVMGDQEGCHFRASSVVAGWAEEVSKNDLFM